jgi:hypothetical protein
MKATNTIVCDTLVVYFTTECEVAKNAFKSFMRAGME